MQKRFRYQIRLSDHSAGTTTTVAAVVLGATLIDKHFTPSRREGGANLAFSLEPRELQRLVHDSEVAWLSIGIVHYGVASREKNSLIFRRLLNFTADMNAGDSITKKNIRSVRSSYGLPAKFHDSLLHKRVIGSIKTGTPVFLKLVQP